MTVGSVSRALGWLLEFDNIRLSSFVIWLWKVCFTTWKPKVELFAQIFHSIEFGQLIKTGQKAEAIAVAFYIKNSTGQRFALSITRFNNKLVRLGFLLGLPQSSSSLLWLRLSPGGKVGPIQLGTATRNAHFKNRTRLMTTGTKTLRTNLATVYELFGLELC